MINHLKLLLKLLGQGLLKNKAAFDRKTARIPG